MKTALVLAGHGSHISPNTAGLVWGYVDQLRHMGVADEVTAAFWKEMPSFHTVLDSLSADDVTIVPLFTAQGFFTRAVIPAEMGLAESLTRTGERVIRYARTLSEHPYLGEVVHQRIVEALASRHYSPQETAVTIIGHGTRRNAESRAATEAQVRAIKASGLVKEVVATYLDDAPAIQDVYELTSAAHIIAVPFFLAKGSHTTIDVPEALGLTAGANAGCIQGRDVYYTDPVGTDDTLIEAILELAKAAGAPLTEHATGSDWQCFPQVGSDFLWETVTRQGEFLFGELRLTPDSVSVYGDQMSSQVIDDAAMLRRTVRENPFRPLTTAVRLPRGWRVAITSPQMLHAVVETVYPGAVADWFRGHTGQLTVNNLDQVTARQVGDYQQLAGFKPVDEVVRHVCSQCVRQVTWFEQREVTRDGIPCPEACNYWLTQAKGWTA